MALAIDDIADWEGFGEEAEALIRKYAPQLLELAYGDASALLDNSSIRWDISNPFIKDVIDTLAVRIRGVSETTKEDVRRWIDVGTEEGLSVQKIAQQIRSNANNITPSRALTIARTESAVAYNQGAVLAYGDAGVQRVEVLDGDEDEVCAAVNGQIWTLEEALADPIAHPNCQRAFAPVVGAVTEEPAAPVEDTRPGIDQFVNMPEGELGAVTRTALDAINSVHTTPGLDGVAPIKIVPDARGTRSGVYQGGQIGINPRAPYPEITMVHELGHHLDYAGIGRRYENASQKSDLLKDWKKSVKNSEAYQTLKGLKGKMAVYVDEDGVSKGYFVDQQYVKYLTSDVELWARSYSQYIAEKSGHPVLLQQLEAERGVSGRASTYPVQWSTEDFAPIREEMDKLFEGLGWLK